MESRALLYHSRLLDSQYMNIEKNNRMKNTFIKIASLSFRTLLVLLVLQSLPLLTSAQCTNDTIPPSCIAPADLTISCQTLDSLQVDLSDNMGLDSIFGMPGFSDNCPGATFSYGNVVTDNLNACGLGTISRNFLVQDAMGNLSWCIQEITVNADLVYRFTLPRDGAPSDTIYDMPTFENDNCNLPSLTYEDVVYDFNCDQEWDLIERRWHFIDWCLSAAGDPPIPLPRLDRNSDGLVGDAYTVEMDQGITYLVVNGQRDSALTAYSGYFSYLQLIQNTGIENDQVTISGKLYSDDDTNCELGQNEPGIPQQIVELDALPSGLSYRTISDSLGNYAFDVCSMDTSFSIHLPLPFNYAGTCGTSYQFDSPGSTDTTINLPIQLPDCPLLMVNTGFWGIRPCFSSNIAVDYQNFSFETVAGATVEVILDPAMNYVGSGITPSSINGDTLVFLLDTLAPLEADRFYIGIFLDCEATVGQTHCVKATISPDTICEPIDPLWSGASIDLVGKCVGDSLEFVLRNVGTGPMADPQHYIVVEDVLMLLNNPFQLAMGEQTTIKVPANGATWHVQAPQEPFHPGLDMPLATIEGCGGLNNPGQAMAFEQNDANPFVSIHCLPSTNSYDPNDKLVFPAGIGDQHFVEANTDLEYMIRFQNTGTAPAIKVVILDTLSQSLDFSTIQSGAASHDYTFERIDEGKVLRFTFDQIMLPDSNANEPASHGFVKYRIKQKADLPIGTRIDNRAGIYFDFNDPIITNTAFVTIGEDIFGVIVTETEQAFANTPLRVYPNPAAQEAMIFIDQLEVQSGEVELFSISNQLLRQQTFSGSQAAMPLQNLSSGFYLLKVWSNGQLVGTAKLVIR